MPRVTVLLTCYNHRTYIEAAVNGVRAQTFRDFEILAIDDGSQDGTREWLAEQPDIRTIFNAENLGTYETLNVGLRNTDSEFVAVLNDDDLWLPPKLARQVELMDRYPRVGLVHTGGWFLNGKDEVIEGNPLGFAWPTFPVDERGEWHGDGLEPLIRENKIIASAALARTRLLQDLGGFNRLYFGSGDWEMWWRVAEVADLGFVAESLTGYRVHGANASHKLERIWRDDERLREWMRERLDEHYATGRLVKNTQEYAFNLAALGTVRMLNGDPASARQAYGESIRIAPRRWKTYARYALTFAGQNLFRRSL